MFTVRLRMVNKIAQCIFLAGICCLPSCLLPSRASAEDVDPLAVLAKQPASLADAPLTFTVITQRRMINGNYKYVGWTPVIEGRILGRNRKGDAVIVELSQNGKLLRTLRFGLSGTNPARNEWYEDWAIRGDDVKDMLTAVGKITATFKYYDDADEKTRALSTRQFTVVRTVTYEDGANAWKYGSLNDDLLGFSYIVQRTPEVLAPGYVWLYAWMQLQHDSDVKDVSYRIEVDGARVDLPDGFDANGNHETITTLDQLEYIYRKDRKDTFTNRYNMYLVAFHPYLSWGKKEARDNTLYFIDHPGKWVIKIRLKGQVARELHFTVLPDGTIAPHPEQDATKPGFLNLGPNRFFAETYFANPNVTDVRFNPDAIRAGMLYGRPWISDDVKKNMLPVLPPKKTGNPVFPQPTLPPTK